MPRTAAIAAFVLGAALLAPSVASADASISAAGSTALQPLVKAAAEIYQTQHPDIKITVNGGGSGQGIAQVAAKSVDMGDSDIVARNQPDLVDHKVSVIGFAVIVNPGTGVTNLSKKQIQDTFSGKVTNWKDVGGKDQKIVVINRPRGSGTRSVFAQTIMGGQPLVETGLQEEATGTVVTAVRTTPGAISYAALSGTHGQSGIVEVSIDGVAADPENITTGKYPIWSYEHIYTNGPPNKDVSRFIAFIQSNSEIVHKLGYILIRDMKVSESDR